MSIIALIVVLVVIGVLLRLANTQLGEYIDDKILKLINVVVFVAVVLLILFWLLNAFGVSGVWDTPFVIRR